MLITILGGRRGQRLSLEMAPQDGPAGRDSHLGPRSHSGASRDQYGVTVRWYGTVEISLIRRLFTSLVAILPSMHEHTLTLTTLGTPASNYPARSAQACCQHTCTPPHVRTSFEMKPSREPVPYWISKLVPLACAHVKERWGCSVCCHS